MVTICIITHDNYWLSRYSIQNLIAKANGMEYELFICDNGSSDSRVIEYGKEVANHYIEMDSIMSHSYCYNEMMKQIQTPFICIFPVGIMVNNSWLSDLLDAFDNIEETGIAAIHAYGEKGHLNPLLTHRDEMRHVWSTLEGDLSGVLLFNQPIIKGIGGFDKGLTEETLAQRQFAFRVQRAGRHTFFVHGQTATDMMNRPQLNPEDIKSYETSIELLKKDKKYKIEM